MERKFFYFKQPVAYTELNAAFAGAENALFQLVVDYGLTGLLNGLVPVQNPSGTDLHVSVTAGLGYDNQGERLYVPTAQLVDCSVDQASVPTTVTTPTFSRIVSVCITFARALSDPRTDGNATTVYFEQAESYLLKVIAGVAALSPTAPSIPSNYVLLGDVTLSYGTTAIVNGNISYARVPQATRATATQVSAAGDGGTRFSTTTGTVQSQLNAIQTALDSLESNGADTIKQFASVAALRATAAAPTYATAAVCVVQGFGLYIWNASSTDADDGNFVITPTGVATGRWLSSRVKNGIIGVHNVQTSGIVSTTSTADYTGLHTTFAAKSGDIFLVFWAAEGGQDTGTTSVQVSDNGGGYTSVSNTSFGAHTGSGDGCANGGGSGYYVCTATGNSDVKVRISSPSGSSSTWGDGTLTVMQIRP
jgi:hypothetical protein